MPSISPDNALLTRHVAAVRDEYRLFNTLVRGEVVELLNGLSNGTRSFMSVTGRMRTLADGIMATLGEFLATGLNDISASAMITAARSTGQFSADAVEAASESLMNLHINRLNEIVAQQVRRDSQAVDRFLRAQLVQGRFALSTLELETDLIFDHICKDGRRIPADVHLLRETNWAYRNQYNTLMQMALIDGGSERAIIDGGSSSGDVIDLMTFELEGSRYFHHNSKSLLQPLDVAIN